MIDLQRLSIIVALDKNMGFSKEGKIPWHNKEDLRLFKKLTYSNYVIMGRKTYEDIVTYNPFFEKEILPGRESFVLTKNLGYRPKGAIAASSFKSAIAQCTDTSKQIFAIGGYSIFANALKLGAHTIYISMMPDDYQCDLFFPIDIRSSPSFDLVAEIPYDSFTLLKYIRHPLNE